MRVDSLIRRRLATPPPRKPNSAMSDTCIFCHPAPDALVIRDGRGTVVVSNPVRPGHVLVGTPRHAPSLHDLTPGEAGDLFALACAVSKALVELSGAEKTYVAAIGDVDRHFHLHLIPKLSGDTGLGPFVFGAAGWGGSVTVSGAGLDLDALARALGATRQPLSTQGT